MAIKEREVLQRVWDGFLTSLGFSDQEDKFDLVPKRSKSKSEKMSAEEFEHRVHKIIDTKFSDKDSEKRSMSFSRLREQLWDQLYDWEDGWAYPVDIYIDDNGTDIFAIVAQSGKLFSVPLEVSEETVTLGTWIQVKEEFVPTTQTRNIFSVRRQKDGKYRWLSVAGTTILNRVAQIDSAELFDSFIVRAKRDNKYPRLDYYHFGELNPSMWEFGTADYLARDGVCYIASGLFDEDHPLAKKVIQVCSEDEDGIWGNSIEFYAYSEPEIIVVDPEVRIPVYKDGENIRISIVLEEDAAGLFTRCVVNQEVRRTMDANTKAQLEKLYGDDTEGMKTFIDSFETGVDDTNQRVKNERLIHRAKTEAKETPATEDVPEDQDENSEDENEFILNDEAVDAIAERVSQTAAFKTLSDNIQKLTEAVATQITAREADKQEIAKLVTDQKKLVAVVQSLGKEEGQKKTEWMQDLPSKKQTKVSYRPSQARRSVEETDNEEDEVDEDDEKATKILSSIPVAY